MSRKGPSGMSKQYSREDYTKELREWTQGDYNSLKHSEVLEDFIQKSDPVRVQTLNRGVSMSRQQAESIQVGDSVSFDGLSSWSSRVGIAQSFARNNATDNKPVEVIYRIKGGSDMAAKVGKLGGRRFDEAESIMSSKAKFKVDRLKKLDSRIMDVWIK